MGSGTSGERAANETSVADHRRTTPDFLPDEALHLNRIVGICESEASDKTKVRRIYRLAVQAVALISNEAA